MKTLYIIEGGDCTGKTTLSRWISTQRRGGWIHAVGGKVMHEGMGRYHMSILDCAEHMLGYMDVVLDRFWPSEWCYGRALKRPFNGYPIDKILARLKLLKVVYVFCFNEGANNRQITSQSDHIYSTSEYEEITREYEFLHGALNGGEQSQKPLAKMFRDECAKARIFRYDFQRDGFQMSNFLAQMRNGQ